MSTIKIIITGATGMVGEGVLFECLQNPTVSEVLMVNRRSYALQHPKLNELIVANFLQIEQFAQNLQGYDACFFCAGISSLGMKEEKFTQVTYHTTLAFAKAVLKYNSNVVFTYISGAGTDTTEKGRLMWARVKGKTENDLAKLSFKAEYNFRPAIMVPFPNQKNWKPFFRLLSKIIKTISPKSALTLEEVGNAMINAVTKGYPKNVLEVSDIRKLANS